MIRSLYRIQAIVIKEVNQLRRDRMTFGMIVMIPLIQLMLFGFAINTNVRHIPVGIVDHSQSALGRTFQQIVSATQVVSFVERFSSEEEADAALIQGKIRAFLVVPKDVSKRLARHHSLGLSVSGDTNVRPLAQWVVDGSDTMIAAALKGLRNLPMGELLKKPVNASVPTLEVVLYFNPEQRTQVNIVPGLVGIILTMTMIMFTSAAIVRERERGNMEMLINTPVKPMELMVGKIIPFIFIGAVQVCIILGLGHLVFDVPINGSLFQLAVATLFFIAASLSLGLVISTIAKNQLQSMQMTIFVLLPSILLSGFIFPYEGMPKPAQYLAEVFPATPFMRLIRGVVLRDASVINMSREMLTLFGFTCFGLVFASLRFKKHLD